MWYDVRNTDFDTMEADLQRIPAIFNTETPKEASGRYVLVNTEDIINEMLTEGWLPTHVAGDLENPFAKHAIKFYHPDYRLPSYGGKEGDIIQMIVSNSHNRDRSFMLNIGIYRFVCSNGLYIPVQEFENMKVRHINFDSLDLRETIKIKADECGEVIPLVHRMTQVDLTLDQKENLALNCLLSRLTEEQAATVDLDVFLAPKRLSDYGDDVFRNMNTIQEKVVDGDYLYIPTPGKSARSGRMLTGVDSDRTINEAIFSHALNFMPS